MKHRALIAALALPAASLAALTAYKAIRRATGVEIVLPITGYDPRDLLSGHYLVYRLDLDHAAICEGGTEDPVFVCVPKASAPSPHRVPSLDAAPASCTVLRGRCDGWQFLAGVERFYIPEEHGARLDRLVRGGSGERARASLVLAVDSRGVATIRDLLIDGTPWRDYLARNQPEGSD